LLSLGKIINFYKIKFLKIILKSQKKTLVPIVKIRGKKTGKKKRKKVPLPF
jgi:hypothetical protein